MVLILFSFLISFGLLIFGIILCGIYFIYMYRNIRSLSKEGQVAVIDMGGQKIFQVIGGQITEYIPEHKATATASATPKVSEEDVQLVADQTGKSMDEARQALEDSEGDLAKAILLLQTK